MQPVDAWIRPMRPEDVVTSERLSDQAFVALEGSHLSGGRSARRQEMWRERTMHLLASDPGGCWVAELDGKQIGFATSLRRDLSWFLATFAVAPEAQGLGLGRALLDAALTHAEGCLRGMLSASNDAKAFRRYRAVGFTMHPQLHLAGRVDRRAIPVVEHVREGTSADLDLVDSLDRSRRDATHRADHDYLMAHHRLIVTDRSTGQGYAFLDPETGEVALLAAGNRRTATRLLWEAVAAAPPDSDWSVSHVTAANEWAIDVGLAARLDPHTSGYLALRGMKPPMPYLHHGSLL